MLIIILGVYNILIPRFKIIFLVLIFIVSCTESFEKTYLDVEDARNDKWELNFIPEDAINLKLRWNIDTWNIFGSFEFSDSLKFAHEYEFDDDKIYLPKGRPGSPSWWPEFLYNPILKDNVYKNGYKMYITSNSLKYLIAINQSKHIGYFWTKKY